MYPKRPYYAVYTDGASRKDGRGGWGYVILQDGFWDRVVDKASGGQHDTTNQAMEMTAALVALRSLPRGSRIVVYTDSNYLVKGMTEYLGVWKSTGWRTTGNKPLVNVELWKALNELAKSREVHWVWVKGHSGNHWNEVADRLSQEGIPEV